ncbi:MAG: helix-hairpin-helix domain-containing protein [Fibrobacter sp.]|jgi:competence protein ComEA|nr:helix-hairpin-helix domain-containing protein [Fibrobacter sp.]
MNSPEKKLLHLAFCLFVVGLVVRFLPWGLPSIVENDVAETSFRALAVADSSSKLEYSQVRLSREDEPESGHSKGKSRSRQKKPKVQLPVHINTASVEQLCALKGVGPKLAEKIIAFRNASGPFQKPEDLEKVPGIGKKKLEGLLPGVIFD